MTGGSGAVVIFAGITDTFTRTISGDWGTSDSGVTWDTETTAYVDGTVGNLIVASTGTDTRCGVSFIYGGDSWPIDITVRVMFNRQPDDTTLPLSTIDAGNTGEGLSLWIGNGPQPYIAVANVGGVPTIWLGDSTDTIFSTAMPSIILTDWVSLNFYASAPLGTLELRVWQFSGTKPISPSLTLTLPLGLLASEFDMRLWANNSHPFPGGDIVVSVDDLDIKEVGGGVPIVISGR